MLRLATGDLGPDNLDCHERASDIADPPRSQHVSRARSNVSHAARIGVKVLMSNVDAFRASATTRIMGQSSSSF